jgi:hypothetical protein
MPSVLGGPHARVLLSAQKAAALEPQPVVSQLQ